MESAEDGAVGIDYHYANRFREVLFRDVSVLFGRLLGFYDNKNEGIILRRIVSARETDVKDLSDVLRNI